MGTADEVIVPDTADATPRARNIRLLLAYDGTPFLGWQVQPQGPTIQSVLEDALGRITGHATKVKGSGRTDAGVHALGQVANFHTASRMPPEAYVPALNSMLPPEVAVLAADEVEPAFDAQFSAVEKTYRYRVLNTRAKQPFEHNRSWQVPVDINVESIRSASSYLVGKKDFSSFRAAGCAASSPVRVMKNISISSDGGIITFELTADGFLRHMVRNIVGTLVEVGRGKFSTDEFSAILEARDRTRAGRSAPPQGLYLVRVVYP
ncbi:MAG TPA: tRNA pseudouridine(38-40) synthase TruA [bacterium]